MDEPKSLQFGPHFRSGLLQLSSKPAITFKKSHHKFFYLLQLQFN